MFFTHHLLLLLLGAASASAAPTVTTLTLPIPGFTTVTATVTNTGSPSTTRPAASTFTTVVTLSIPGMPTVTATPTITSFPSITPGIGIPGFTTITNAFKPTVAIKKRKHTVSTPNVIGVTTTTIRVPGFINAVGTLTLPINPEQPTKAPVFAKTGFETRTTKKGQHGEHATTTNSSRVPEHTHVRRAAAMRF